MIRMIFRCYLDLPWIQLSASHWLLRVQLATTVAEMLPLSTAKNPCLRPYSFWWYLAMNSLTFLEKITVMIATRQLCHLAVYRPPPCLSIWLLGWLLHYQRSAISLLSPYSHEHRKMLFVLSAPHTSGDTELFWYSTFLNLPSCLLNILWFNPNI